MLCNYKKTLLLFLVFGVLAVGTLFSADFGSIFTAGEQAFSKGNYVQATEYYTEALKLVPSDLKARFRLGQSCFLLHNYVDAQEQFQVILSNSPGNISARVYYAEALIALGANDEAMSHLNWVLKVQPEHARARYVFDSVTKKQVYEEEVFIPEVIPTNVKPLPVVQKTPAKVERHVPQQNLTRTPVMPTNTVKQAESKPILAPTPKGYIHIPAQPASILPVEYQAKDDEDFFQNYPASFLNKCVEPDSLMAKATKLEKPAAKVVATRQAVPANNFAKVQELMEAYPGSFFVNLEGAKYYIESGELAKADKSLRQAEAIAMTNRDSRGLMETKIFRGLIYMYQRNFVAFGQHLMGLKSSMAPEAYQTYLDIYNQGMDAKEEIEQLKISAGVAMGATHYAVAADLLKKVFLLNSDDVMIGRLLSDAQVNCHDYKGAEITLSQIARANPKNAEAYLNLARFYLTVDYKPQQVREYANYAYSLDSSDVRCGIVLGLLDYSEGSIEKGITRIQGLLSSLEDPMFKAICEKIISDGETNTSGNFVALLALPGTKHALNETNRMLGEEYLKRSSFFMAAKVFESTGDYAELGRTYLGLGSMLVAGKESKVGEEIALLGKDMLQRILAQDSYHARANLYIALYYYEHSDVTSAREAINRGLKGNPDATTAQRLASINNLMG